MLFSDNGIIKQAQNAANKTKTANEQEQEGLANLTDQILVAVGEDISSLAKLIKTNDYVKENTKVIDKEGKELTVPKDFKVTEDSNEVNKGVVIEDRTGNQFVWVPVSDPTTMYEIKDGQKVGKLYNFSETGYTAKTYSATRYREPDIVTKEWNSETSAYDKDDYDANPTYLSILGLNSSSEFATQLQTEFDEMIASVEKYKGFYIGRYETGNLAANTTTTPVVKRGQTAISSVNWYYQYQNSKKIAGENSAVKSSMIWGCQYDRTLQWLVESGNKTYPELENSTTWGNYYNATFEYIDASGATQTKAINTRTIIPTGSTEYTKANNIYDLAGNVCDWTIESDYTHLRVFRRGWFRFLLSSF